MKKYLFLSSLIFLVACGTTKIVQPLQTDADRGAAKFPDLTLAQLTEGKAVHEQYCTGCHKLPSPRSQKEGAWKHIVPNMVTKANRKFGNGIDAAKEQSLLRYLIVMGKP
jgi:cytochrome c5